MSDIKITNYNKSKIYKIYCEDEGVDEIYVGSTTDLRLRTNTHKYNCNNINSPMYGYKLYNYIRNNFGWDNFTVKTLERFSCENEIQLRTREQKWINELKPTLNSQKAYLCPIEHKQYRKGYMQEYRQENLEILKAKKTEIINCSKCDKTYTRDNKNRHMRTKYCLNYTYYY